MGVSLQSWPVRRELVMESPPLLKVGHSNQVLRVTSKSAGNFGQTLKKLDLCDSLCSVLFEGALTICHSICAINVSQCQMTANLLYAPALRTFF